MSSLVSSTRVHVLHAARPRAAVVAKSLEVSRDPAAVVHGGMGEVSDKFDDLHAHTCMSTLARPALGAINIASTS